MAVSSVLVEKTVVRLACSHCEKSLRVSARAQGRKLKCPNCRHRILIPHDHDDDFDKLKYSGPFAHHVSNLVDPNPAKRADAAFALRRLKWTAPDTQWRAIWAVANGRWNDAITLGTEGIRSLIHMLKVSERSSLTDEAAQFLLRLPDAWSEGTLHVALKGLKGLKDRGPVETNQWSFLVNNSVDAIGALTGALDSNDVDVRMGAVRVLCSIRNPLSTDALVTALFDGNPRVWKTAAEILIARNWIPTGDVDLFLVAIRMQESTAHFEFLPEHGERLIGLLTDKDSDVRAFAAEKLGRLRYAPALNPLIALLRDPWSAVACSAVRALGEFGDQRAVPVLLEISQSGAERMQMPIIEALAVLADPRGYETLVRACADDNEDRRRWAIIGLGKMSKPDAIPTLLASIETDNATLEEAGAALTQILEASASRIPARVLVPLSTLKDVCRHESFKAEGSKDDDWHQTINTYALDCSRIRELASQELARRSANPPQTTK